MHKTDQLRLTYTVSNTSVQFEVTTNHLKLLSNPISENKFSQLTIITCVELQRTSDIVHTASTDPVYTATQNCRRPQTFLNSFSSSAFTDNITDSDWRHMSLKTWNMSGDWSAKTRIHVAIRSTSSSVIG